MVCAVCLIGAISFESAVMPSLQLLHHTCATCRTSFHFFHYLLT
jgi:hypothetical protein